MEPTLKRRRLTTRDPLRLKQGVSRNVNSFETPSSGPSSLSSVLSHVGDSDDPDSDEERPRTRSWRRQQTAIPISRSSSTLDDCTSTSGSPPRIARSLRPRTKPLVPARRADGSRVSRYPRKRVTLNAAAPTGETPYSADQDMNGVASLSSRDSSLSGSLPATRRSLRRNPTRPLVPAALVPSYSSQRRQARLPVRAADCTSASVRSAGHNPIDEQGKTELMSCDSSSPSNQPLLRRSLRRAVAVNRIFSPSPSPSISPSPSFSTPRSTSLSLLAPTSSPLTEMSSDSSAHNSPSASSSPLSSSPSSPSQCFEHQRLSLPLDSAFVAPARSLAQTRRQAREGQPRWMQEIEAARSIGVPCSSMLFSQPWKPLHLSTVRYLEAQHERLNDMDAEARARATSALGMNQLGISEIMKGVIVPSFELMRRNEQMIFGGFALEVKDFVKREGD